MSANPPQLRPMSVGDILDQAIRIYRRNFVPLVIIVAIVSLPYVALQLAITLLTNPFPLGFSQTPQSFDPDAINTGTLLAGQLLSLGLALAYGVALVFPPRLSRKNFWDAPSRCARHTGARFGAGLRC
ncbi:hypothetical protein FBQ82_16755 [Anaerolineae bacterium CFX7]|nr:hypothetical protein [Anaerolineae bacterium CFX7]